MYKLNWLMFLFSFLFMILPSKGNATYYWFNNEGKKYIIDLESLEKLEVSDDLKIIAPKFFEDFNSVTFKSSESYYKYDFKSNTFIKSGKSGKIISFTDSNYSLDIIDLESEVEFIFYKNNTVLRTVKHQIDDFFRDNFFERNEYWAKKIYFDSKKNLIYAHHDHYGDFNTVPLVQYSIEDNIASYIRDTHSGYVNCQYSYNSFVFYQGLNNSTEGTICLYEPFSLSKEGRKIPLDKSVEKIRLVTYIKELQKILICTRGKIYFYQLLADDSLKLLNTYSDNDSWFLSFYYNNSIVYFDDLDFLLFADLNSNKVIKKLNPRTDLKVSRILELL
ncbi:MAG: hypothetical protein JXR63_07825 [Spirochaetales bacterium]|nr:hypothetical protein [Spirochaetales bacterium]